MPQAVLFGDVQRTRASSAFPLASPYIHPPPQLQTDAKALQSFQLEQHKYGACEHPAREQPEGAGMPGLSQNRALNPNVNLHSIHFCRRALHILR